MFEFLAGPHYRIHLAPEHVGYAGKASDHLSEAYISNHKYIDIARSTRRVASDRSEHQREIDVLNAERVSQHVCQSVRLENNLAHRPEKWVSFICGEVPSIAVTALSEKVDGDQAVHFLLNGPKRKAAILPAVFVQFQTVVAPLAEEKPSYRGIVYMLYNIDTSYNMFYNITADTLYYILQTLSCILQHETSANSGLN